MLIWFFAFLTVLFFAAHATAARTSQGVEVLSHANSPISVRDVQQTVRFVVKGGLCSPAAVRQARVMLVAVPWLIDSGGNKVILGLTYSDGSIIVATRADLLTTENPFHILIHEFAHFCQGDSEHKNTALWKQVDEIYKKLAAAGVGKK